MSDSSSALGGQATERELLTGYLDWYRAVVEAKVADLLLEDASRIMTPTGLSPLGIVKHLGDVEQSWFRERFAARTPIRRGATTILLPSSASSRARPWRRPVAFIRDSTDHSRRIVAAASLDDASAGESPFYGHVSLRWILVHMLEETARHAGHLDIMREQIDGKTGD